MGLLDLFRRRKETPEVRRFTGARPTRIAGGFSSLSATLMEEHRLDLMGLVAHSRHLAQNNDYYRAFIVLVRRHVVGPHGIAFQAQTKFSDGSLDLYDNAYLEREFAAWGRLGNPTVCGRYSWIDLQQMAIVMTARDGGVFVRFHRGRSEGRWGLRLQIFGVDRLDTDYTAELADGGYVSGGVECDGLDRPVAWHFRDQRPGAAHRSGGRRIRIPAEDMIYVAVRDAASVHLSMPWAHTAMRRVNMIGGFEEAALTAARAGASKMGFFTRTSDDDDIKAAAGEPDIEEMEPGMMETLPVGYDVKAFDTRYPDGESPQFIKLMLRGAAAGMGVSYNGLANDLEGTNFSSLHVGKSEERDEWRLLQNWFSAHFCDRIYREWLSMAMLSGALNLPFAKMDKFLDVAWKPRGWQAVNPVDEANANIANVGAGFTSPQRVVAAKGADYDEILAELREAKAKAEALGLSFTPQMVPINAAAAADAALPVQGGRIGQANH